MSPRPTISVVIPYHDEGGLLAEALGSICAQTFAGDLEVIVVDDASEQPPQLPAKHRWPIQVLTTERNVGAPAARNWGAKHAGADILCFLDADDVYLPERVKSHVDFLESHPEVIMVGGPHYIEKAETWLHIPKAVSECFPTPFGHRCAVPTAPLVLPRQVWLEACTSYFLHSGMITVRRAAFEQVKGFQEDLRWGEEWDLGVRLARLGRIGFVPTPGMRYLCRSGSITSTLNPEKELSAARIFRSWRHDIPELPSRSRRMLRGWERNSLLLAAQSYWEDQHQASLALRCAFSGLLRSPSIWAFRSVARMALHSARAGARQLLSSKQPASAIN